MSIDELKDFDQEKLRELLKLSGRASALRRNALCKEIGINPGEISNILALSEHDFAVELIDLLLTRKLESSIYKLCNKLDSDFEGGNYISDLTRIKEKLHYIQNSIEINNSEDRGGVIKFPKTVKPLTVGVITIALVLPFFLFSPKILEFIHIPNTKTDKNFLTDKDYHKLAFEKQTSGDNRAAIELYTEAIKINSKHAYAYANRGLARSSLGYKEEALKDYNQAIQFGQCGCFYEHRGDILAEIGNKDAAIKDYQEALSLYQKDRENENIQKVSNKLIKLQ